MTSGERAGELESANAQLMRTAVHLADTLTALAEVNASLEQERASRERAEAELRLAHRLEAVGQLAAGVAHEINTPIQYIGDSVHFLQSASWRDRASIGSRSWTWPRWSVRPSRC